VALSGSFAYVADGAGLHVIDVSAPANCVRVGAYRTGGYARGVAASGNYGYVADGEGGLVVIDVSNPANCVRVGGCDTIGNALDVAVSGNYAYVVGQDGVDPRFGNPIGTLQVIDVRDPANCVRVGGLTIGGPANSVAVFGNYAYVAGTGFLGISSAIGVLRVIDVSNPANPVGMGAQFTSGDAALAVAVSGNYAYVADNIGLEVVDVSNPTHLLWAGRYDLGGRGVAVSGNHAYVTGYDSAVFDVSDPTNLRRLGSLNTIGAAVGVVVSGKYAYVADGRAGIEVIDVSDPTNCVRVGGYDTSGYASGVAVAAGRIYVADGEAGLLVLLTLPNVQFTVRVEVAPGVPFTLESATDLSVPLPWTPLLITNVPAMPFDYVDFDVKLSDKPQKFYRVRQP
jgi:hypothetical protein